MARLTILLAVVAAAAPARADDSNFRPYLIGARAAGMGGAFTALADDGSGPYYNPGGIAFAKRSSLSLSASVYGVVSGTLTDALGSGRDFTYSDLNTFPVSTAVVRKFGDRDTPDGSQNSSIALTVFVPDAFRFDDRTTIAAQQNAFFLSDEVQTVWGGLSYARRIGRLGVGASGFVLLGSETNFLDLTAAPSATTYATITARSDVSTIGFIGAAGLRYDASDHLRLGLSVFSPSLGSGTRRSFTRVTVATPTTQPQIATVTADDLHATPALPVRVQAGAAWADARWTIAADAIYLGPRSIHDDPDRAAQGLDRRIVRNAVVNGSLGAELVIADVVPVRLGAFTDLAASAEPQPNPPGTPDPNATNTDHINRFGGTLSVGYRTEHTATDVGAIVSYGAGHDVVPSNLDFTDIIVTRSTQRYTYVFIASSYEF
jgi:long-chain fatty acid transport protein